MRRLSVFRYSLRGQTGHPPRMPDVGLPSRLPQSLSPRACVSSSSPSSASASCSSPSSWRCSSAPGTADSGRASLSLVLSLLIVYFSLPSAERTFDITTQVTAGAVLFTLIGIATALLGETRLRAFRRAEEHARLAAEAAGRAEEERLRAEEEAVKAEEAAAESEQAAHEAAEALSGQLRAEEAVRRSELELSDFFENASIGIHWLSANGTIIRSNRAELQMLGYEAPELLGRRIADCHADPDVAEDILRRLSAGRSPRRLSRPIPLQGRHDPRRLDQWERLSRERPVRSCPMLCPGCHRTEASRRGGAVAPASRECRAARRRRGPRSQ